MKRLFAALAAFLILAFPAAVVAQVDVLALDAAVRAACPQIDGVSVGDAGDRSTWIIQFRAGAACQEAAQTALQAYTYAPPIIAMQLVSSSTPALNGAYPIDPASQQKVQAISLYIAVNGKFPAGQAQQAWPDAGGALHSFPTTAAWQAFATAMADFVAAVDLGQPPAQPVTIP